MTKDKNIKSFMPAEVIENKGGKVAGTFSLSSGP